jgi:hypothetical protein
MGPTTSSVKKSATAKSRKKPVRRIGEELIESDSNKQSRLFTTHNGTKTKYLEQAKKECAEKEMASRWECPLLRK